MTTMTETIRQVIDDGWLFGGEIPLPGPEDGLFPEVVEAFADPRRDVSGWASVTLPHVVCDLSWRSWDPAAWEKVWAYRRPLELEAREGERVFVEFDGAMTNATVSLDGVPLGEHRGGYLPFRFEITDAVRAGRASVLAVALDARFNVNVPPNLPAPALSSSIDYLQPGGIHRSVSILRTPSAFVAELALTHGDVLDPGRRRTEAVVTIDAGGPLDDRAEVVVRVLELDGREIARASAPAAAEVALTITGLDAIELWDLDAPRLYRVVAELRVDGSTVHTLSRRTGYREARFETDGFFLNGTRRYLMGVNRHGYFPFGGFAMPDRVHRRDAEIIKNELNCQMVRCSHYPQTASFLDACDELGLVVWEESPGWQYVGDDTWQDAAVDDITAMIARDRHRPSIVVWGARLNETADRPEFYARTEALVKELDPSRATSGTMFGDYARRQVFQHDVFSYDDYTTRVDETGERIPVLLDPVPGKPYLVSEAISTRSSPTTFYLRNDGALVQQHQALDYAVGHDHARGDERFSGLLAWVGFDYEANMGNHHRGIKTSGLGDVFRVLKPGAAIYRSQIDPRVRPVIAPAFTWDPPEFGQANAFGGRPEGRLWGPGERAMICSNLDRLEVRLGGRTVASAEPDRERFPHLEHAPTFVDLRLGEEDVPDLEIDGYLGGELVLTHRVSGTRAADTLALTPDDEAIVEGNDATRVVVAVQDRHGVARGRTNAIVELRLEGPAELVGDPRIDLAETGAVAAVWVRSTPGATGRAILTATADGFGAETAIIDILPAR
ncbi:glycoside hydrolase family 2 protein [Agromyces silvae]|uniref:glycoside hydrolase family 2 protein n=1 Tax=Agromyces silvae TaxID=3388266 RepID=UPI00280A9CF7|nr:glycoside hydrolase family 2 TIM barrel-domain containing protein [Agromyces protaetiae]